jgi:[ribosomal protein S5]-alanine N-acetyltransferase
MEYLITTPRLQLRKHVLSDAPYMLELNRDPEVIRYTGDTALEDIAAAEAVVHYVQSQYEQYGMGRWVVELRETGEILGWCGLKMHPDEGVVDIGYRFYQRYWRKGYAFEAAAACFKYGVDVLHLTKMIGRSVGENTASVRILEKLGFQYVRDETDNGIVFRLFEWHAN